MRNNRTTIGIFLALFTAFAFGAYPAASQVVYKDGGNTIFIMMLTTWVRALFLTGLSFTSKEKLFSSKANIRTGLAGGFFQALSVAGIFAALHYLPGPLVIIIIFTHTLMLLFFMAWRREIKLDFTTIITAICALIGLAFVLDIWHQKEVSNWVGIGFAFAAAIATMSRLYVYGQQTKARNPAIVGAESFLCAAMFVMLGMFVQAPTLPASFSGYLWAAIACASLGIGTCTMFYCIARIGSFNYSMINKLEPVFTALFSFLLIGEVLNWTQYLGIGLVTTSLLLYQYMSYKKNNA